MNYTLRLPLGSLNSLVMFKYFYFTKLLEQKDFPATENLRGSKIIRSLKLDP